MQKISATLFALLVGIAALGVTTSPAQAVLIFSDTFESSTSGTFAQNAVPETAAFGSSGWYGANFGTGGSAGSSGNARVAQASFFVPTNDLRGSMEKSTGFLLNLDTSGFSQVELSLAWNTRGTDGSDMFRVSYIVDAAIDTQLFGGPNLFHNLSSKVASFTSIFSGNDDDNDQFPIDPFSLPTGESSLWVAFWLDDGGGDFGQFDDVKVEGTLVAVPEPATSTLFVVGLLGVVGFKLRSRRRD